jgi:hypothetical protein
MGGSNCKSLGDSLKRRYIDDSLDDICRVALGRPCPDRDHCRERLADIVRAIMVPPKDDPYSEVEE